MHFLVVFWIFDHQTCLFKHRNSFVSCRAQKVLSIGIEKKMGGDCFDKNLGLIYDKIWFFIHIEPIVGPFRPSVPLF